MFASAPRRLAVANLAAGQPSTRDFGMSTSEHNGSRGIIEPVAGADPYVIAGVNLRAFVADWVSDLETGGGQMRGLLEHAQADPQVGERYEYDAHYLFANIGPRATEPTATPEELLLFAVMAVYQNAGFPGADRTVWDGEEAHVRRAFAYIHEFGEQEAARWLRADVIRRSLRQRPPELEKMLRRSMNNDPARIAAHDRKMASIDSRGFRAVELLDPDGDFDSELTALLP